MKANLKLTAVFEAAPEGGFAAHVAEIPGANTQGETLVEARMNLYEALEMLLDVRYELAGEQQTKQDIIREYIRFVP